MIRTYIGAASAAPRLAAADNYDNNMNNTPGFRVSNSKRPRTPAPVLNLNQESEIKNQGFRSPEPIRT
jgi:hypothetical protein